MVTRELDEITEYPVNYRPLPTDYSEFRGIADVFAESFTKEAQTIFELINKTLGFRSYYGGVASSELQRFQESDEFMLFVSFIVYHPDLDYLIDSIFPFDNAVFHSLLYIFKDAMELQDWQAKQRRNPAIDLELKLKQLVEYQPRLPVWLSYSSTD